MVKRRSGPTLARDRLGEYQAQAAIAALHSDAPCHEETDWVQIVGWYDELLAISDNPVVRLNRAVAMGEADGPQRGLAALAEVDDGVPRHTAVAGTSTRRRATSTWPPACTPRPRGPRSTSRSATISPAGRPN